MGTTIHTLIPPPHALEPARAAGFGGELRRHKAGEPLASAASRLFHCT
eukprot:gene12425-12665_t